MGETRVIHTGKMPVLLSEAYADWSQGRPRCHSLAAGRWSLGRHHYDFVAMILCISSFVI
jgi:hypothetical protein